MQWFTPDDAEKVSALWPDADLLDPDVLGLYLSAAKAACIAYAPAVTLAVADGVVTEGEVPDEYRLAQVLQARNLYNSTAASPGGDNDGSGFGLTSFPLDWQVQQLLRPRRGMGAIA